MMTYIRDIGPSSDRWIPAKLCLGKVLTHHPMPIKWIFLGVLIGWVVASH